MQFICTHAQECGIPGVCPISSFTFVLCLVVYFLGRILVLIKQMCWTVGLIFQLDIFLSLMFVLGNCICKWEGVILFIYFSFNDAIYFNHFPGQKAYFFPEGSNFWRVLDTGPPQTKFPRLLRSHSNPYLSLFCIQVEAEMLLSSQSH